MSGDDKASASPSGGSYAPYGQLVKMLMPSVGSIAIYGPDGELVWCSDGYERPDLRGLLESLRASDTVAGRGKVESTSAGVPAFVSGLRGTDMRPLGSIVIELSHTQNSRYSGSMVASLLRPVLDCLESRLGFEAAAPRASRGAAERARRRRQLRLAAHASTKTIGKTRARWNGCCGTASSTSVA